MSEEIKEDEALEEVPEDEDIDETAREEEEVTPEAKEKPVTVKKKSGKKKWIFIFIILVLLGGAGAGLVFMPENLSSLIKKDFDYTEVDINEDNLREEDLAPFFIPPGPETDTIRIDLIVVWDALASIRYEKKELSIRNMIYDKFYETAQLNEDLNTQIPALENEIGSMMRKSLGVQNLLVRIKEIRYF